MVKKEKYILLDKYIDFLLENSDASLPMWNIEQIRSGRKNKWNYIDACMISAYLELYEIKKDKKYLNFCDDFVSAFVNEDGSINTYDIEEYNIDNIRPGKNLFKLFELTGKKSTEKLWIPYTLSLKLCRGLMKVIFGIRKFILIRSGLTDFIWHSPFIWSMKQNITG